MRTQRLLARVPVSAGKVLALAFRSDGARLGVATDDGVAVLDPRGSVLERTPTPHSHQAIVAEVDGELVMVLSGQDGTFRSCRPGGDVVDLAGARARPVPREGTTRCAAYDATRGIAAFGAPDGHVYTVDVRAGTVDRWRCGGPVVACAIAGDGTVVAATRTRVVARPMSGEIRVIDVRSPVEEPLPLRLTHVAAGPRPDQVWLGMPLGVGLLDLADDTLRARFMAPQIVDVRSLATDDTYVYVGTSFGTVLRWPHDDPAKTVTLSWHEGVVAPLSVHGERVISVDLEEASVQIGHRGGRRHGPPLRGSSPFIQALAVDPDGDHIATGSADGSVHVWRTRDPTPALQHPTYFGFGRFVFDEDGSVLIAAAGIAARGDPERGVVTSLGRLEGSSGDIPMLALHSGRLARAGSRMLSVHDSVTGRTLAQRPIPVHSTGVAFLAPDLVWVAINGGPRRPPRFQSWRLRGDGFAAAPEEDVVIHDTWQRFAIFWRYADVSRDGTRIAVACYDGTVRVYSRDGSRIGEPLDHCAGDTAQPCFSVAFSGDGKLLLSSGLDGTVKLWHRQPDGRYAFAYLVTRFPTAAHAVDFHPDGERIACTSAGGTIRVMRLGRSTPEEEFHGGGTSYCCRFTPDGTRLSATGYAGWFRTWFLDHDELRRRAAALTEINTGGGPRRRGPTGSPGG